MQDTRAVKLVTEQAKKTCICKIEVKGYKKFKKQTKKLLKKTEQLNRALEKSVELRRKLF